MTILYDDNFGYWHRRRRGRAGVLEVRPEPKRQPAKLRTLPRRGPSDAAQAPLRAVRIRARMRRAAVDHGLRAVEAREGRAGAEVVQPRAGYRRARAPRIAHEGELRSFAALFLPASRFVIHT